MVPLATRGTLSASIARDLRRRLAESAPGPADPELTLTALARHYGVSLTPVREAVAALVDQGVLLRSADGRVAPNPAGVPPLQADSEDAPAPEPTTSHGPGPADDLESALAMEAIQLSLHGRSDYLREEATAARHGVGRSVIRQVFSRLAGRGLIEHVPRCGWRVRAFDARDLAAYLDAREALELKALDLARPHLDPDDLRRMLAGNAPSGDAELRLDNQLHAYLVERSGNPYIREFFERHGPYFSTLLDHAAPAASLSRTMARQHRQILRALLARDWPAARRALARHIRAQRPVVERFLRQLGREPVAVDRHGGS